MIISKTDQKYSPNIHTCGEYFAKVEKYLMTTNDRYLVFAVAHPSLENVALMVVARIWKFVL